MILLISYLFLALVISFLCSLLEAVLLSVSPSHVAVLVERGSITGKRLQGMKKDVDQPLAAILTLNTFAHTLGAAGVGAWTSSSVLLASLLIAYIPLTHMSHFFTKWFTWHKIRWDDQENVKGGRIEKLVQNALQYPVSWSAPHINADGKKSWADLATEEVAPKETK